MDAPIMQDMDENCRKCGAELDVGNRCMVFGVPMCPACAGRTPAQRAKAFAEEQMTALDEFNGLADRGPSLSPMPLGPLAKVEGESPVGAFIRKFFLGW
jgi:hypothetical protein